jgi:protection-of-telomeres protein 1
MLSDYSGDEDSDPGEYKRSWTAGKGAPAKVWEWRFALEVEDAGSKGPKERMWLLVDNASAQCLLDMDATK